MLFVTVRHDYSMLSSCNGGGRGQEVLRYSDGSNRKRERKREWGAGKVQGNGPRGTGQRRANVDVTSAGQGRANVDLTSAGTSKYRRDECRDEQTLDERCRLDSRTSSLYTLSLNSHVYSHATHMCTHTDFSHATRKQNSILSDTQATQTLQ